MCSLVVFLPDPVLVMHPMFIVVVGGGCQRPGRSSPGGVGAAAGVGGTPCVTTQDAAHRNGLPSKGRSLHASGRRLPSSPPPPPHHLAPRTGPPMPLAAVWTTPVHARPWPSAALLVPFAVCRHGVSGACGVKDVNGGGGSYRRRRHLVGPAAPALPCSGGGPGHAR